MNKFYRISTLCLYIILAFSATAQYSDFERAKNLINNGQYLEGAKLLRPFADDGNDEAQAIAAWLFFNGKGVTQSDEQGVKYATLAAGSYNEDAILLLLSHYYDKSEISKAADVFGTYAIPVLDTGVSIIRKICKMEDRNKYLKSIDTYFLNKAKDLGITNSEVLIEKLYETNPNEGEIYMELSISSRGSDEDYYSKLINIVRSQGNTSTAFPVLAKMVFEGRGTLQDHGRAMRYAHTAVKNNGSHVAKYLIEKYKNKRLPGYHFRDAIIFKVNDHNGHDMVVSKETRSCRWQDVKTNLSQMGQYLRLPTKEEAAEMMPYYCTSKGMRSGETITIWAVRLVLADVYYWQTYDHTGKLVKEEPNHNYLGSSYNGMVTLLPVWSIKTQQQ